MKKLKKNINHRKSKRVSCLVPVDGKKDGVFDQTKTIDISKGGVGFLSIHKIPLNQKVAIEIELDENSEPVIVVGKVRWVEAIESASEMYRVGMSFEDILSGSKSRLTKYLATK